MIERYPRSMYIKIWADRKAAIIHLFHAILKRDKAYSYTIAGTRVSQKAVAAKLSADDSFSGFLRKSGGNSKDTGYKKLNQKDKGKRVGQRRLRVHSALLPHSPIYTHFIKSISTALS